MGSLYDYYYSLYEKELSKTRIDEKVYYEWLEKNFMSYSILKKNYDTINNILLSLLVAGIPIEIITNQSEIILTHALLSTIIAITITLIKKSREEKFTYNYFTQKEKIVKLLYENQQIEIMVNDKNLNNNFEFATEKFAERIEKYNKTYNDSQIFLSDDELEMLSNYLKKLINKHQIPQYNNYLEFFIDILNRVYARGLYTNHNINITDFIDEIYKYNGIDEDLKQDLNSFHSMLNIHINNNLNIIDIGNKRK